MPIVLTDEQQKIVDDFKEFLQSDEKFFLISAPAGTGKTFLTKYLYKEVYEPDINLHLKYPAFVFTATTHKAVDALETQLLGGDFALKGQTITTIHSLLGLEVKYDLVKGETLLKLKSNAELVKHAIIVVDECSMVSKDLFRFLNERTFKCKVILIGDEKQLPPVKSGNISPVFTISGLNTHSLTKTIRNQDHDELKDLCSQLRTRIDTNVVTPIKTVGNIYYLNEEEFNEQIKQDFLEPNVMYKILAYTNKRVNYYNELIAKLRGKEQYYNEGDYYVLADMVMPPNSNTILFTDTELRIDNLSSLIHHNYYDLDYYEASVTIPYFDLLGNERKDSPTYTLNIPSSFTALKETLGTLKTTAVKEPNKESRKMLWREYFKVKETFADLRYRDACTVHKSQGTTLKNVYIDLSDLGTCTNPDTFNKLLYVAVSRAKENVYFTGSLPSRYGSIIS